MKPREEVKNCPCGRQFIRTNWKVGSQGAHVENDGRPREYCDSCREAYKHGRRYGTALKEVS